MCFFNAIGFIFDIATFIAFFVVLFFVFMCKLYHVNYFIRKSTVIQKIHLSFDLGVGMYFLVHVGHTSDATGRGSHDVGGFSVAMRKLYQTCSACI